MANSLLALALAEGLVVSFWRALLNGCTVSDDVALFITLLTWLSYLKQKRIGMEATHFGEQCRKAFVETAESLQLVSDS